MPVGLGAMPLCAGRNPSRTSLWRFGLAPALRVRPGHDPRPGAAPLAGDMTFAPALRLSLWRRALVLGTTLSNRALIIELIGATTFARGRASQFWVVFPPRCRDPCRPGGYDPRPRGRDSRSWAALPAPALRLPGLGGFPASMPRPAPPWRAMTPALEGHDPRPGGPQSSP